MNPTRQKNGADIWGQCRIVSGLNAYLYREGNQLLPDTTSFFLILISKPIWAVLNEAQRKALVDHELAHVLIGEDDKGRIVLSVRPHDVEEFSEIIERHGLWRKDLEKFGDAVTARQPSLFAELDAA